MHNPKTLVALGLSLATHVSGAMALRAPLLHVVETAAHPSDMSELDSPKPLALFPPEPTSPRPTTRRWQWLVVLLMGLSLLLHGVILFVPIPSQDRDLEVPEEEVPQPEEAAAVDILSLSDLPVLEEPPADVPPEQPPPSNPPPQEPLLPPVNLDQAVEPDESPIEESLPEESPIEEPLPDEIVPENDATPPFNPARQSALLGQADGINVEFDGTANFPQNIWDLGYLQSLNLNCFFGQIGPDSYRLLPQAERLKFFTRNYGLVVQQDLPLTFSTQTLIEVPDGYCGEQFFEVQDNGVPTLYVSAIKIGPGNPPASILLIFWTDDPRF
jgi:hypothetical protein